MWRGGSLMLSVQQFWSRIPRVMPLHGYTIWVTFSNRVLLFSNADAGLADSYKPTQNTKCLGSLFLLKSLLFTACKIALKFQPKFISDVSNVHSKPKKHGTTSNVKVRSLSSSCQRAPTGSETKTSRNHEQKCTKTTWQVFAPKWHCSTVGDAVIYRTEEKILPRKERDR